MNLETDVPTAPVETEVGGGQPWWCFRLARDPKSGRVLPTLDNVIRALTSDAAWAGVLRFNVLSQGVELVKAAPCLREHASNGPEARKLPRGWTDGDTLRARAWLERNIGCPFGSDIVNGAVTVVAQRNSVNPIRQYLESLTWDGTARIGNWLTTYAGVPETDYSRKVGAWWLVSAIARAMKPGDKVHHVLITEGRQGTGKSSVFEALGGEFFSDTPIDLGDKDAYQQIRGLWIVEMAELDSLNRADKNRAKAFFTSAHDRYRPSYGRHVITVPRSCVFVGTTNHEQYLSDETGGRRWWPVRTGAIDVDALKRDRDQIWAEAMALYTKGERWWPKPDEFSMLGAEQAERVELDPWHQRIAAYVDGKDWITTDDILADPLDIPPDRWTKREADRIGRVMRHLGWARVKEPTGKRRWCWRPPDEVRR